MSAFKSLSVAVLAATTIGASAQSGVTIYGSIDQYVNYLHSSSGSHIRSLEDGAYLRSRLGFRGTEDLGAAYSVKFTLEHGLNTDNGTLADGTRFFDRQAWVGLAAPYAEIRIGRQNGPIFYRGCNIDYNCRTLGSIVNTFGTPSRYDNAISVITTRTYGVLFDAQVSLPESTLGNRPLVYQVGLDWKNDMFAVGYAGLRAKPPKNAAIDKDVVYDNAFFNVLFGATATIQLAYVHSNNSTATAVSNNAGTIVSNVGGINTGTNPDLRNFYDIWQISGDYRFGLFKVGALWGKIDDKSGRQRGATGGAIGLYYDLSKRTTLMAMIDTLRNDTNGGWRPAGSAGLKTTFTDPADINGRRIDGAQVGIIHRF